MIVCENRLGELAIEYQGKPLTYTTYRAAPHQAEVVSSKQIAMKLDSLVAPAKSKKKSKLYVPPSTHPWRRFQINPKSSSQGQTR